MEDRQISVRALVQAVLVGGDIARTGSVERMLEGLRGHKRLQGEYGAGAVGEVALSAEAQRGAIRLTVQGRADVVWERDGQPFMVEEIKTTRSDPTQIAQQEDPQHWAQAYCYGHMLCERYDLPRIEVRLTYAGADGGAHARVTRGMQASQLARLFYDIANAYIQRIEQGIAWRGVRDASLGALPFPYERFRPGQRAMAAAAYRACRDGGQLVCEAPTGIGKSAAMLFAALKAMGEGHIERIFYLTARGTTGNAAREALSLLREKGLRARSLALTAKDKVCPHPDADCMPNSCPRAAGHFDRTEAAREEALASAEDFDAHYLDGLCERHRLCPHEFALDLSLDCDVIIGDYNYAFDPYAHLRRYFDEKSEAALLIDEAHNLPDRARDMFSASLDRRALEKLRRELGRVSRKSGLYRSVRELIKQMKEYEQPGDPANIAAAAERFAEKAREALGEESIDGLLDCFFMASAFTYAAAQRKEGPERYEVIVDPPHIALRCLLPASLLAATYAKVRTCVFFSATLTPAHYYRDVFGAEQANSIRLPSPFPSENLLAMHCALPVHYRAREHSAAQVADAIGAMCSVDGNYIAFFPSYAYLHAVMPLVQARLPHARVIAQRGGMDERARVDFLGQFSEQPSGVLLAFAVMGGLFSEGIDLPGARLAGCAVVGIGLPQISPEREALRSRYDREGAQGFAYAYAYPGLAKVVQSAGRVIRSACDRGIVLLIDERFMRPEYGELLPGHWRIARMRDADAIQRAVRAFWRR